MPRLMIAARAALLLLACFCTASLNAQQAGDARRPTRVPVTLVLADSLPPGGGAFVITRRTDVTPRDVILLRADADAAVLSEAVGTLIVVRGQTGDTARVAAMLRRRPAERSAPVRLLPWADRVLNDLRSAPVREVPGVGEVRAVEIWLPPQRGRARTP